MSLGASGTRVQRRAAYSLERQAIKSGKWGGWERFELPNGIPGTGWCKRIRYAFRNHLYAVLVRPVSTREGEFLHCAIRTASNLEPPWRDKQRIKDELFGSERVAIEVMPARSNLVDEADMYHMWVMPEGSSLPFGLKDEEAA